MPLLLRTLGAAEFGIWGAASSLAWLTGFVDIGTGAALVTLVARASALESKDDARSHLLGALGFGSGMTALLLLATAAAWLAGMTSGAGGAYLIAFVGLALNVPLSTANNTWMALQKGYVSGFWETVQTVLTLGGLVTAVAVTRDVRVYVAIVYAALVLANLGSLLHLLWEHPELRPIELAVPWAAIRRVAGHGMMYFALAIAGGLSFFLDNILALELLGPEASAQMTIAMRICMLEVSLLVVVSQPLWPAFAEAAERADRPWIWRGLFRGMALLVALTVVGSVVLVAWGEPLLRWWLRADLGIGRGLLGAIAAWIVVQALTRVPSLLLNGLSIVRFQIVVFSVTTTVALALKFLLAPRLGVAGILWPTTATIALIFFPAALWRIDRWARHPMPFGAEGVRT
jgi:O-antigen/teichoic acid export membrane protein